jgi:Domain of unknown function (DUF317)
VWVATFGDLTPVELVAAFPRAVVNPAGIARDLLDPARMLDDPADNPSSDTTTSG